MLPINNHSSILIDMKKTMFFLSLIGTSFGVFAQNNFPSSGNVTVSSGNIIQSGNYSIDTQGSLKAKNYLLFDSDGDFTGSNYYTIQDDPSGNYLRMGYNFSNGLVLNSAGNVGIGTSNLGNYRLTVNGDTNIDGELQLGPIATQGGIFLAQKYSNDNHLGTLSSNYSTGALIMGYGAAGMPNEGVNGQLVSTFDNVAGNRSALRVGPGTLEFLNTPRVQTAKGSQLQVTSRFFISKEGNVGLGTATPQRKLEIVGGDSWQVKLSNDNEQKRLYMGWYQSRNAMEISTWDNGTWEGVPLSINPKKVFFNGNIGIGTQATDYYDLATSGNISVGADGNASLYARHINGKSSDSFDAERLYLNYGTGHDVWVGNETVEGSDLLVANGNIGIGTTTPSRSLTIYSEESNTVLGNNTKSAIRINNSFATSFGRRSELQFGLSDNPNENLAVIATEYSSWNGATGGDLVFGTSPNNSTSMVERMRINNEGNIGIGTIATGSHKLAVDGSIGAREIKVEVGTWSDFVFEKNYALPTLKEVEDHIATKGHLKDIPSAVEVEKNGIFLGEMDAKLLQKIEELTLYTIQQEKKISAQEATILQQQKELDKLKSLAKRLAKIEALLENKD